MKHPKAVSRSGTLSGFIGAIVEAWAQLRIGKMRVLLSLVGVAVAVAAMTFIIAFGQISAQAQQEMMEKWNGRAGTVNITVSPQNAQMTDSGSQQVDAGFGQSSATDPSLSGDTDVAAKVRAAQEDFIKRYEITRYATSTMEQIRVDVGGEPRTVQATVTSGGYALLHHTKLASGRWFTADDEDDLSPAIIIDYNMAQDMGITTLTQPVRIQALRPFRTAFTVVGVLERSNDSSGMCWTGGCVDTNSIFVLEGPYYKAAPAGATSSIPTLEVWGGAGSAKEMTKLAKTYFDGKFGQHATSTYNNEHDDMEDFNRIFTLVVAAAGSLTMLLGALGLINISLVTVRQRIHEIGVRRSFGATSRRVFFSIMMESVVATVVAGLVGIIIAIVATHFVPWGKVLDTSVNVVPAFPMSAAFIGLLAATVVGALAGIIPAIVAVRIRPIDAIRI